MKRKASTALKSCGTTTYTAKASGKAASATVVKRDRAASPKGSSLLASFKNARKGLRLGMSVKRAIAEGRGY